MRYFFEVLKFLINKKNLWLRDEGNTNKWLHTFREYMTENNKKNFLSKLDKDGQKLGNRLLKKIENIMYNNILPYADIFSSEEKKEQEEFATFCLKNNKNIPFNLNEIGSYLNYFYIKSFTEELNNIQGKDIIDCGGYNGDSSLAMNQYFKDINKIYCIEPETKNFTEIKKNIKKQQINNIIPLNIGLGKQVGNASINSGGAGSALQINEISGGTISIETIDAIVQKYNIQPGLIKRDIEGFEYDSILGAENTIKKHKPTLVISIYHTGKDWFEILPLIDSRNLGYKFTLTRWNCFHPFADTLLVCY